MPGVIPGLQDLLCRLLGIGFQQYPIGNSLELCRNPPGLPLDSPPGIIPGLEDHLPEVLLGIPGTLQTLRPD